MIYWFLDLPDLNCLSLKINTAFLRFKIIISLLHMWIDTDLKAEQSHVKRTYYISTRFGRSFKWMHVEMSLLKAVNFMD